MPPGLTSASFLIFLLSVKLFDFILVWFSTKYMGGGGVGSYGTVVVN